MYRRLSTCFCGAPTWEEVEGAAMRGDEVLVKVSSFFLGVSDRALMRCLVAAPTLRVLGSVGMGKVVDQGPLVEDDLMGRVVVSSPLCRDQVVPIDLDGAAQLYWSIPRECVEIVPSALSSNPLSTLLKYVSIPKSLRDLVSGREILVVGDDPLAIAVMELFKKDASRLATLAKFGPRRPLKGVELVSPSEKRRSFDAVFVLSEDPIALRCAVRLCRDRGVVVLHYVYRAIAASMPLKSLRIAVIKPAALKRGIEVLNAVKNAVASCLQIAHVENLRRVLAPSIILF